MRRPLVISSLLLLSLMLGGVGVVASAARASEPAGEIEATAGQPVAEAEAATENVEAPAAGASPWEHPLWHNATTMMRLYLCDHARRPPSWCGEPRPLPGKVELPDVHGPPLHEDDAEWLAFLEKVDPSSLTAAGVAEIRRRAVERRDPQAMEILGYLYAEGVAVQRDYAESYRWYGLAYLAGEQGVRANMDVVWNQLQRHDLEGALAVTREFNALAAGEVPPGLAPIGAEGANIPAKANAPAKGDSASAAQ